MGARLTGPAGLTRVSALPRPAGAILAGGRATRHGGTAKGLLEVGGVRIIDRIADALAPVVDSMLIVANTPGAAAWMPGVRVVPDLLTGGGSAAGVHAALRATGRPTIVVAWDLPFVTTDLFRLLIARAGAAATCDAVAPAGPEQDELEPLCALYAPTCAGAIETEWDTGDRSLHGLLRRVATIVVPLSDLTAIGSPERLFFNVNSPDDLDEAERLAANDSHPRST